MQSEYDYLLDSIPTDHCKQCSAIKIAEHRVAKTAPEIIVDLGCGTGSTFDIFRAVSPSTRWIGVDIEESPEVAARTRTDAEFRVYNGVDLPFEDNSIDFIYSNQVFEHVRYPEKVLNEVCRVLSPGGLMVGQTSHLEPYHSYSYWNFTVYGFKQICESAGLRVQELRPGIDGATLVNRTHLGRPKELSKYFEEESPLNIEIEEQALKELKSVRIINFRKLMLCGQFCFICTKL